jgi:translation elongation factor EF-4
LETSCPEEFQGTVMGQINQRRGIIMNTATNEGFCTADAEVPLAEMFGYSTDLRSKTQGKASFTMEFSKYRPVPSQIQEQIATKYRDVLSMYDLRFRAESEYDATENLFVISDQPLENIRKDPNIAMIFFREGKLKQEIKLAESPWSVFWFTP